MILKQFFPTSWYISLLLLWAAVLLLIIAYMHFSIGLSRERVRQVGLVALEKLKHVARKGKMEAMLVKH